MKRIDQKLLCLTVASTSLAVCLDARAQEVRTGMQVNIVVDASGEARVYERYRLPGDTSGIQLQLLDRPCTTVRDVAVWNYRDTVTLQSIRNGPWQILRDSSGRALNADSSGFDVSYRVSLNATSVDIPVLHLTRPIPRREAEGAVLVSVTLDGPARVVDFPTLTHGLAGSWSGSFVAAPSFVHVAPPNQNGSGDPPCQSANAGNFGDGGLSWRFWTLVLIMVAWVPIYLAWARRTREHEA